MITIMIGMALTLTTVLTYIALKLRAIHRHLVTEDRIRDIIAGHPSPDTPPPGRRLKIVAGWTAAIGGGGWLWRQLRQPKQAAAAGGAVVAAGVTAAALILPPPEREQAPLPEAWPAPTAPQFAREPELTSSRPPPATSTTPRTPTPTAAPIIYVPSVSVPLLPLPLPTLTPPILTTTVPAVSPPIETPPGTPSVMPAASLCVHPDGRVAQRWICLGAASNRLPG